MGLCTLVAEDDILVSENKWMSMFLNWDGLSIPLCCRCVFHHRYYWQQRRVNSLLKTSGKVLQIICRLLITTSSNLLNHQVAFWLPHFHKRAVQQGSCVIGQSLIVWVPPYRTCTPPWRALSACSSTRTPAATAADRPSAPRSALCTPTPCCPGPCC